MSVLSVILFLIDCIVVVVVVLVVSGLIKYLRKK